MPGMTVSSSSSTAKRARPSIPSISRPKYQKMAERDDRPQMPGSLASGQVTSRQIWPLATASGIEDEVGPTSRSVSIAQTNMLATHRRMTRIVVLTSSVPIRNHGSPALRRSGTENEKRPAMGPNRILEH